MTPVSSGRDGAEVATQSATAQTRVLVADDDPLCRRLMQKFLEQANYDAVLCENGTAASDILLGANPPLIAILDWMMPDIAGPDVCSVVREENLEVQPYLIILTSKRDKGELAQALDSGADDFLTKPFNPVELAARLKVAERSVKRQTALQTEIQRLRSGDKDDPGHAKLLEIAVGHAVDTLGLGPLQAVPCAGLRAQVTWTPVVFPEENVWIDVLTEAETRNIEQSPEATWRVHQAIIDALRLERPSMITPFPAKLAMPDFDVPAREFHTDSAIIRIASLRSEGALHRAIVGELRIWDVLAEPYPPRQEVPLLRRGAVLNNRIIARMHDLAAASPEEASRVHVYRPSPYALAVNS
jgi:CheY-like chemotaxis protein